MLGHCEKKKKTEYYREEKCDITLPKQQNFWISTIGGDVDGDEDGKKAIGLY